MNKFGKLKDYLRFKVYAPLRLNRHSSYHLSCSQFGEDMIVRHLLSDVERGFYVDIGAHHPIYYSNTYHFYCRGWRGINVDAVPGSMELFNTLRPRDINVEACVDAVSNRARDFMLFDSPALNTASSEEADRAVLVGGATIIASHTVRTVTLPDLLDAHLPPGQQIDFLTIDVEGLDEPILRSHDFERFRPRVLVFERKGLGSLALGEDPLIAELRGHGYELVATTGASAVMRTHLEGIRH